MAICKEKIKLDKKINIIIKDVTDSTNADAKKIYKETKEPVLIIAEEQTAGRGRLDRKFSSPKGKGIYMSLAFDPKESFKSINLITPFAAVAVSRAIERIYNINTGIKWVNDIFINKKKVCGILSEIVFQGQTPEFVIVGVGINVHKFDFQNELKDIATSIESETNTTASRNRVIEEFVNELLSCKNEEEYLEEYKRKSVILGKKINVISVDGSFEAFAEDVDHEGNLIVSANGEVKKINAGEVSVRL